MILEKLIFLLKKLYLIFEYVYDLFDRSISLIEKYLITLFRLVFLVLLLIKNRKYINIATRYIKRKIKHVSRTYPKN